MATQRDLAEHLDLSIKRISELIRDGILPSKMGRSPLNLDVCRIAYISYLRKLGGYHKKSGTADIAEEKTRLTKAQADKAELEVSSLEGELIPAKLVQDTWSDLVANVRAKLLGLPSKIAHQVIAVETFQDAELIIKDQVYETLDELAETNGIPTEYASRVEEHQTIIQATTETND